MTSCCGSKSKHEGCQCQAHDPLNAGRETWPVFILSTLAYYPDIPTASTNCSSSFFPVHHFSTADTAK